MHRARGIIGNIVAGRLGDTVGRKRVGFVLLSLFPIASFGFYHGGTQVLIASWVALVFCSMGGRLMLRALATELFPTSHRAASSGMFTVLETLGGVTGLLGIYFYETQDTAEMSAVIPAIATINILGALILLGFPETKRRTLEDIH